MRKFTLIIAIFLLSVVCGTQWMARIISDEENAVALDSLTVKYQKASDSLLKSNKELLSLKNNIYQYGQFLVTSVNDSDICMEVITINDLDECNDYGYLEYNEDDSVLNLAWQRSDMIPAIGTKFKLIKVE